MKLLRNKSNEVFSDGESDNPDDTELFDNENDFDGDRFDEIRRLREDNKPIPRKLRTHNLLLTEDWCRHWGTSDGIREIVQNFFDGICTAFNVKLSEVVFKHQVQGAPGHKNWKDIWIATNGKSSRESVDFGRITFDRKRSTLTIINERVTLSQSVLLYGKTDKRSRSDLIGGFGEGMKIGILRLSSDGCAVRYRTGSEIWKFGMRTARGSSDETLHYITSDATKERKNLEVLIRSVEDDDFEVETFLPLSRDLQKPVDGSVCHAGFLLEAPERPDLRANRVYVKGLFVHENSDMRVSANFAQASVNRDRNMKMVDREFRRTLAKIWSTVFASEKDDDNRQYTSKFLLLADTDEKSVEFSCIDFMNEEDAACLYNEIIRKEAKAFPYKKGEGEEAKLISASLKKHPYPVHENLLQLLSKLPQVMSVYKAQEEAFLSDSSECPPSVYGLPLACMIKAYTSKIAGPDKVINVKFHKPATNEIDALLKDETLICSQELVQIEYENEQQAVRAKLDAIQSVERELRKCFNPSEQRTKYFETMAYVASDEFRSYFCPKVQSSTTSDIHQPPITTDSSGTPLRRRKCNCRDQSPSRFAVKRSFAVVVPNEPNKNIGTLLTGLQSPAKKFKSAVGHLNTENNSSQEGSKNLELIETTSSENESQQMADEDDGSENEVRNTHKITVQTGTGAQAVAGTVTEAPPVQRNMLLNQQAILTPPTRTVTPSAQRMRFTLDSYEVVLSHQILPTPQFAIEHTFGSKKSNEDTRDISLNLANAFPCCSTNDGDLLFTASIRKQE